MKTNYIFKARWLQGVASENGSKKMRVNPWTTPTSVAFNSLSALLRLCGVLCILFTLGVGNAWATATSGTFTKITSTSNLTTGYYVIVASESASTSTKAVGSSVNSDKRITGVDVTITSGTTISNPDDAIVFLITKNNSNYTFKNVNTGNYLYQATTTSGKGMGFKAASANITCAGYNSSSPIGFKFTLDGASNNIFKYNNGSVWFANYSGDYSTTMTPVRLFKAYKVTYDGNGKTGGSVPTDATYYSGNGSTNVTVKTNSGGLVKTGYTFAGWNTKADGTGQNYTAGTGQFTITANTTLYAKWEAAAACSNNVTISKGSESHGTFTLSISGSQATCDGLSVVVTPTPSAHYHVSSVTATTPTTGGAPTVTGPSAGTYTVTYAANSTGSSTINVAFAEDSKASITLSEAGATTTDASTYYVGDSYTLPSSTSASCGTKVLVGWSTVEVAETNTKPASNFYEKGASVTLAASQTFYAVFAALSSPKTYAFNITGSDFNTTSYAANNNEKYTTATATDASGATVKVYWTSNQIMKSGSDMQWQKSAGYIYNSTDLGTVNSVTITSSAGSFTTYYGTTAQPSSGTTTGSGKGFFKTSVGNATGTVSNIAVNFTKSDYTKYSTTCSTPLGQISGSVNMTSSTDGTVTIKDWSAVSNASSYTVKLYKLTTAPSTWTIVSGTAASGASGAQGTRTGITNRTTGVTYSGLEYGATYKFTVQAIASGATYCDGDETAVTNVNSNALTDNKFLNKYSIHIDDGTDNNYAHNYISSISSHSGSVGIMLNGGTDFYQYKLSLGGVIWWGNTGKMTSANCTGWTFSTSDPNCKLQTAMAGTYTFTLAAGTPAISVTYPSANQASGHKIYFDNSVLNWSNLYYRIGRGDHNQNSTLTLVTGTDNFYYVETPAYENMAAWHIANNVSWSGSNSIYKTKTGDGYAITNAIAFQPYVVTGDITIVPTTTHSTGGDDQNNNCEFYTINTPTSGLLTHTATVTAPTNGTITLAYTSKSGSPSTSTVSGLPHRTNLVITTTPATGYNRNTLTVNGAAFTSGNTHILAADATIAATFSAKTYSITLDREGGTTGSTSVTMTYNSSSHTSITAPTKAGFEFAGWWTGDDGTGSMVMNASGVLQANVAGYTGAGGIWTKDATCTLYAKWTVVKTFVPVTSSTTLEEDDEIIFYGSSNFMSTTQSENNRGVTTSGYTASGSNYLIPSGSTVQIAKLEATDTDNEWLFNVGTDAYLYAASNSNNYLRTTTLADAGDNGVWTISVDGSKNATITAQGTNTHNLLRYNSSSSIFSCYSSGQTAPKLYYYRRTDPYITVDPSSFETFTYAVGYGPSLTQALTIKGYNLTGSLTIACPSGYELSSTSASSGFGTSSITLTKDAKNKVNTTIYIRLAAGKSTGSYNQTLSISGGGITTENISLTGSVVAVPGGTAYSLVMDEDDIFPDDEIVIMNASGTRLLSNKGTNNRTAAHATSNFTQIGFAVFTSTSSDSIQNIVIEGCDDEWLFKAATNSYLYAAGGTNNNHLKAAALNTAGDNGKWKIRINNHFADTIKAQGASTRNWLWYNGTAAPNIFSCYQGALTELPAIYAKPSATANVCGSPSKLEDFETTYGEGASEAQSFKVKGRNLTSDITVSAPTGYEVCLTEGGTYTASVTLTRTDGKVAPTTVYVRLKDEEAGTIEGNITIAATGATTRNIAVSGTVAPNPEITLAGDPLLVTSRNGMNIMAANTLTLNIHGARAGQTVSITGTGLKFYKNDGTHYVELTGGNALTAPVTDQVVYVSYNPTSAGTGAIETPSITVSCDGGSETFSSKIKVRNLPDAVAIVAKVNGVWQALPANISSASNPAPVQVSVATDGGVKKAYGASTLAYKLWPVKTTNGSGDRFGTYSSPSALNAAMVRFAGNNNKGLWANDNKSTNTINNNAAITEVGADVTTGYEWIITTTESDGQFVYTLTSTHGSNTNDLRLYSNRWGTYGSGSGTNELYILPLVEVQDAALTVMEWSTNEMAVSYPNGGSVASGTFKAMIGEGDKTTVTATSLGGDMYKLTGVGNLQANPGKVLTLSMTESGAAKQATLTIPLIVTTTKTEAELRSSIGGSAAEYNAIAKLTDVVIRDGGTMTTGTASGNFNDLYIYPGGKAVVSNNMSFGNVYLRGGYSFLSYADKEYGYPDLCVKSGTITTTGVTYDLYVDNRYYYTFSMPYDVELSDVHDETGSDDFNVWVKHYNGGTRASGSHVSGWEWYGDEPGQGSFFAGIGYEITAKPRVSGRPMAIIRFPVKSGNITTDADREIGVSVDNYGYDDYGSGSLAANNVGWNFVGNPYLTAYKAGTASPGNANDTLMLVDQGYEKHIDETTGVWDGTYDWKSSNKRFITVPYDTQTDFHSEYVATYTIPAFSAFFIQTTASGTFYMRGSRPQAAGIAPRFGQATKQKPELHIDVLLSGEGESVEGKAGLIIHDKYEGGLKDFEDVEQWFVEQNELKTYTFAGGTALAYNLTDEQTVQQPIPMGYIATVAGEHTYSINEANDVSSLAHLWLTDNETGITTDLLVRDYVFTTAAGRFDERFVLSAVFKLEEVITYVGDVGDSDWIHAIGVYHEGNTLTLRGLPENSAVYIYDMTGKLTASRDRLHNVASFSIAAQGVYNIRVVNGNSAVTLRSVLR